MASNLDGRHSDTVTAAIRAAERARAMKCTCFKPYENGPCVVCEEGIAAAVDYRDDPDAEEMALQRMERMHERHLDHMGGAA